MIRNGNRTPKGIEERERTMAHTYRDGYPSYGWAAAERMMVKKLHRKRERAEARKIKEAALLEMEEAREAELAEMMDYYDEYDYDLYNPYEYDEYDYDTDPYDNGGDDDDPYYWDSDHV